MAKSRGTDGADEEELRPLKASSPRSSPTLGEAGVINANRGDARTSAGVTIDSDMEVGLPTNVPTQWSFCPRGSGCFEFQGYETWTSGERVAWKEGRLKAKWGLGQVSIRLPISSWASFVAILYGYLPFLIPFWWVVWALTTYLDNGSPRFFPIYGIWVSLSFAIVNETVTKQVCKRILSKNLFSRPSEAVCKHPGMPSGHVLNAYTLMVWCLWEVLQGDFVHLDWFFYILLAFGPVPWARVYNKDHTVQQVLVSAVLALVMGTIAYYVRCQYFPGHSRPWEWDGYHNDALEFEGRVPNLHTGPAAKPTSMPTLKPTRPRKRFGNRNPRLGEPVWPWSQ